MPLPRRAHRVRTGCVPCKQRRKKCDERKPTCSGCDRNQLLCTWPDPNKREKPRHVKKRILGSTPAEQLQSILLRDEEERSCLAADVLLPLGSQPATFPCPELPRIVRAGSSLTLTLYGHFVHSTVPNLAIRQGARNPWASLALPYAHSSEMFLHACLAISSAHIERKSPAARISGYIHYGKAMQGLKYGLTSYVKGQGLLLPLLMTSLALVLYEVSSTLGGLLPDAM